MNLGHYLARWKKGAPEANSVDLVETDVTSASQLTQRLAELRAAIQLEEHKRGRRVWGVPAFLLAGATGVWALRLLNKQIEFQVAVATAMTLCAMFLPFVIWLPSRRLKRLLTELSTIHDPEAVNLYIECLNLLVPGKSSALVRDGLAVVLRKLGPEEIAKLTPKEIMRLRLVREGTANRLRFGGSVELDIAVLDFLEKIGDNRVLSHAQMFVKLPRKDERHTRIIEAAERYIATIKRMEAEGRPHEKLLRASNAPQGDDLLRPATGVGEVDPLHLLRPMQNEVAVEETVQTVTA
jgi:hypothetical protein